MFIKGWIGLRSLSHRPISAKTSKGIAATVRSPMRRVCTMSSAKRLWRKLKRRTIVLADRWPVHARGCPLAGFAIGPSQAEVELGTVPRLGKLTLRRCAQLEDGVPVYCGPAYARPGSARMEHSRIRVFMLRRITKACGYGAPVPRSPSSIGHHRRAHARVVHQCSERPVFRRTPNYCP